MTKYLIIDTANLFYRARHGATGDPYSKAGLALHLIFRSIRKMWRDFGGEHVVFCLEGKSWRFDTYPQYKAHRRVADLTMTKSEREEDQIFRDTFVELTDFLINKTNTTVLQRDRVEGDDFIARWIQMHPGDEHLIVSGDTDFIQLLADNVQIYDGVRELLITKNFVKDKDGDMVEFSVTSAGKLKIGKKITDLGTFTPETDWWRRALFMKCIRGDAGDNIFSAYPKVRETKMKAAWDDRHDRGFDWNNLFLQTWTDYDDNEQEITVKVQDKYKFNQSLIDLTLQPDDIKTLMDEVIVERVQKPRVGNVGIHMLRFCEKNGLVNISREASDHTAYLNVPYAK